MKRIILVLSIMFLFCILTCEYCPAQQFRVAVTDVVTVIDTFAIKTANYTNYFQLQDMFTSQQLAGDYIQIYVRSDAGGP